MINRSYCDQNILAERADGVLKNKYLLYKIRG